MGAPPPRRRKGGEMTKAEIDQLLEDADKDPTAGQVGMAMTAEGLKQHLGKLRKKVDKNRNMRAKYDTGDFDDRDDGRGEGRAAGGGRGKAGRFIKGLVKRGKR